MDYNDFELSELKVLAKERGISVGNMGKVKIIEKLEALDILPTETTSTVEEKTTIKEVNIPDSNTEPTSSILDSITDTIDELDDAAVEDAEICDLNLPIDATVPVKSITFGGLSYKSRSTNAIFRWNQIGAIEYMTIAELNEMNNYKRDFLNTPLVILLDERAIKKFRLTSVYENVAKINNLTAIFNSDMHTIETVIDNAIRVNMRDILVSKVRQMVKTRKLVDINIIRLLEDKLKFDLSDDI